MNPEFTPKESENPQKTTHFGFNFVPIEEKVHKVGAVFDSVSPRYDLMNDLMSFGLHRWWKWICIHLARIEPSQKILDLAAGSGDLSLHVAKHLGNQGELWVTDINASMLNLGANRLLDAGFFRLLHFVQLNAENLPYPDHYFDRVMIGFGLRNVTDQNAALKEMSRVLRSGGRALVLEFSKPRSEFIQKLYQKYSFHVIPILGELIAQEKASYQYLVESIQMHPDAETLKKMMLNNGFDTVDVHHLCGGIVCIHIGFKF